MIRVKLFGPTSVEVDGQWLAPGALRGRPRQILEILAVGAGAPVAKDRLADLVWDGEPPASHHGTLESYVCNLRHCLGVRSGRGSVLATSAGGYQLAGPSVSVDLTEARAHLDAATGHADVAVDRALDAVRLTTGDLLESEPYAAWAERTREVFAREAVATYVRAAGLANATRRFGDATRLAVEAVRLDRLCELAWQQLIRSYWLAGRHGEALRAYADLRQVVLDELGDEPGPETRELYFAVLRDSSDERDRRRLAGPELETLLVLLRQSLASTPGAVLPALDSALSAAAVRVIALQP
ncbi:BTAD domain-containing putative transcriptional regulator [Nocardioides kongjuensis]|uniref:DNA-binding SARP family transcriptional activator n=1 Tax=Nocardioides kongjuensis TaxID=349522 RepID=A0A852RRS2_9ACTN|nr:BTAD domain-containing putative transcriptional regulator [Nocardioides kongjuensis]NYD30634.1 DNA-binding SARP family transcriptional activator [Nocardioides kongjuensis]